MITGDDISVCIPTIPVRRAMCERALRSVYNQTLKPKYVFVEQDYDHEGAAATRNRVLRLVTTPWVAFLDDDDVMYPNHLQALSQHASETGADVVYSWPDVVGAGGDPTPQFFGKPFDPDAMRRAPFVHVTTLVRTEFIQAVGGFQLPPGYQHLEDWGCWLAMLESGAMFSHLPERTWRWNLHEGNTSGLGERWQDDEVCQLQA